MPYRHQKDLTISHGFSLIEVMIASLILVVGVTGFATMQNHVMSHKQATDLHAIAVQVAKQKMIELRHFEQNRTSEDKLNFQSIADDQGGASDPGEIEVVKNTHTENTHTFNLHWEVSEQYFVDSDDDGKADKWVTKEFEGLPLPVPDLPPRKEAKVQVSWINAEGEAKKYELSSFIAPIPAHRSFHAFNKISDIELTPNTQLMLAPHHQPILHELNKNTLQTSSPMKYDSKTQVTQLSSFQLTYNEDPKLAIVQQQREFAFTQCRCRLSVESNAKTPAQITLNGNQLAILTGKWINKLTGTAEPEQSPLCSTCCRDHHDTEEMMKAQNYYRKESDSPHTHFQRKDDGKYIKASKLDDQYDEVCRFQRVNGEYELLPDLQALQTLSFPKTQMTKTFNVQYQKQVSNLLKAHILGKELPLSTLNTDVTVAPSASQLQLQSIYMERLKEEDMETLQEMILKDSPDWLKLTPFLDIELTLHGSWKSSDTSIAYISNQAKQTTFSPKEQQYASYSRGRLVALTAGDAHLSHSLNPGNEGIIDSPAISVFNQEQIIFSPPLQLKVLGTKFHGLAGDIYCVSSVDDIEQPCSDNQFKKLDTLKIYPEKGKFSCTIEELTKPNTSFFSCSNIPNGWLGKITIDSSKLEAEANFYFKYPSDKISKGKKLTLIEPVEKTSNSEYWLIVEFTS
ncbi:prepilin-type N-terminal cleavage/methylation domain-containing protein [Aliiglaciecola sp. 3_MG-2023]|uniref:type IV pilus modification PilV family protein n=1 Tax=Aliiglaciecola sp. 3_MG-2023 TaxID=3062644 RepID=UPI0026E143F6|nr:prepilin-type N-terminal cleavage/methylation domain-containing protein [Aliiglaciecola sp. 3_MG-2023]MDO6694043.1 prepilin-type N-terminal cleavage/methylation domain-containing protein [Aliiglaciecola sp. 3_MG-2023]